jgi:hypothetical protein
LSAALAGDENTMAEKQAAVKLKQVSAQQAMHAPSSAVFLVWLLGAAWWWWSQSGIAGEAEISIAVFVAALAAKPSVAGNVATDRPIRMAIMVRPTRIIIQCFVRTLT